MTGEVSIYGDVLPVGGVSAKIVGAKEAGAKKVLIPADNWQNHFSEMDIDIKPIHTVNEALEELFDVIKQQKEYKQQTEYAVGNGVLTAEKV